ncbi:MAG: antitermination protein NusB, partial [Adlercreutzia sp.]|nr:antitermination protein NusB [Adlercreutzia sp.]
MRNNSRRQFDKRRGSGKRATSARELALSAIHQLRERDAFAQDVIAKTIDDSKLSREDRAFATRLVLGVVSMRGT